MHATNQSFGISPMYTGTTLDRVTTFGFDHSSAGTDHSDTNTECPVTIDICPSSPSKYHGTQRYFELGEATMSLSLFRITWLHKLNKNNKAVGFLECNHFILSGKQRTLTIWVGYILWSIQMWSTLVMTCCMCITGKEEVKKMCMGFPILPCLRMCTHQQID